MSNIKVNSEGYADYGGGLSENEVRLKELEKLIERKVTAKYKELLEEHKEETQKSLKSLELLDDIPIVPGAGENSIQIRNLNGIAIADNAISIGEGCVAGSKAFFVASIGDNTYTLDSLEGLEVGDVCSVMFLDIVNDTGRVDRVYQDFGTISAINTSTNTITFDVAAPTSSDPTMFVGFMCVLKKPNIGTQMTGIGAFCGGLNGINLADFGFNYGTGCLNVGKCSFVGGLWAKALNRGTFSWGNYPEASGPHSFAANNHTKARAANTCSLGDHTTADSTNQLVQGRYNIKDIKNIFAHIVGNGTDEEHRSNAYTLDWDGNGTYAGEVFLNGGKHKAAKEKVWETIATITVEPDENGELPSSIAFTKDSDGNDIELTDFYLETQATLEHFNGYTGECDIAFEFGGYPDYQFHVITSGYASKWYLRYLSLGENGGGMFVKPNTPIGESASFENDFNNIGACTVSAGRLNSLTSLSLVLTEGDGYKFMSGSTFTLKGVRK